MRKMLVVFLLAVVAGYAGARLWETERVGKSGETPQRPSRERESGNGRPPFDPIHWARNAWPVPERDLSDWSEQEIHAALEEGVMDVRVIEHQRGRFPVVSNLFSIWMRRNPGAAFEWFGQLKSETIQRNLAATLATCWPKERINEGLEYLIKNREVFEQHGQLWTGISWWPLVSNAVEASAEKGPEDLVGLLALLEENNLQRGIGPNTKFPENFDFRKLATLLEAGPFGDYGPKFYAPAWVSRRPDEAFQQFVTKRLGEEKTQVEELFSDVLPFSGENDLPAAKARAKWLAGKIDAMPEEHQRKVVKDLMERNRYSNERIVSSVILNLESAALCEELMGDAVRGYGSRLESVLSFVEGADDVMWRVVQLKSPLANGVRTKEFTTVDENLLRERLISWKVKPEEVESVVRTFKGGGR